MKVFQRLMALHWTYWIGIAIGVLFGLYMVMSVGHAADMAVKAAPQPVQSYFGPWTGFYIGPKIAYGYNTDGSVPNGWGGGVQIGYDWQAGNFIVGLVTDINAADWNGNSAGPASAAAAWTSRTNWYGTTDVRVGFPGFGNHVLLYGLAGIAYGGRTMNVTGGPAFGDAGLGWNAGGGLEVRLMPAASVFTQYKHIDIGSVTAPTVGTQPFTTNVFEGGMNFRF